MGAPLILGSLVSGAMAWAFSGSIVAGLIMTGLTLLGSLIAPKPKMNNMKPASLADFQVTQSNEGQPVPIVYGTVDIPGNIIFYGNLQTKKIKQKAGGKGGGSKKVTTGYQYFLDMWQTICMGKVELVDTYMEQDTGKEVSSSYSIWNDGTMNTYPNISDCPQLQYSSRLPGIAHIFWKKFYVGENRTYVPTVTFRVRRILTTGISNENMSNGSNPAAAVYDLLTNYGGILGSDINMQNFNDMATYYKNQGYGINYTISSTTKLKDAIDKILEFVDSFLDYDEDGKIVIKSYGIDATSVATIEDEFEEFSFSKPSFNTIPNHFITNFVEGGVVKSYVLENQATKYYAGRTITSQVDLTLFSDRNVVIKRLTEIMKRESYPRIMLSVKVPIKYSFLNIHDVVTVKNNTIGFAGDFRVTSISEPKIDENTIELSLLQNTDILFDDTYVDPTIPTPPEFKIQLNPFTKIRVYELDYTTQYGYEPAYLIMVARETGYETGFGVFVSKDDSNYELVGIGENFSIHGTLQTAYPNTTYDLDDTVGFTFRPSLNYEDTPLTLSRTNLFLENRVIIVDNEIMAFQNYAPSGTQDYNITGIVRGVLYTSKANHNSGANAYITTVAYNVFQLPNIGTFYLKIVPLCFDTFGALDTATRITVTPQNIAKTPLPVSRIRAVRSGSTVTVDLYPITKEYADGAGKYNADSYTDQYPILVEGQFLVTYGSTTATFSTPNFTITQSGAFTLSVKHFNNGLYSSAVSLSVGSADGEYIV